MMQYQYTLKQVIKVVISLSLGCLLLSSCATTSSQADRQAHIYHEKSVRRHEANVVYGDLTKSTHHRVYHVEDGSTL